MNRGLFPATMRVRSDFIIDIGQLMPKQASIIASNTLILRVIFLELPVKVNALMDGSGSGFRGLREAALHGDAAV